MVINIAVALLAHHLTLFITGIFSYVLFNHHLPGALVALYYTLFAYSTTVLMLLFAAEAVNLFVRIVIVFSEINHYVTKATVIAWSKQYNLYNFHC